MKHNISKFSKQHCTSCGNCSAICPVEAISFYLSNNQKILKPKLDNKKCIECGLCIKNCPALNQNLLYKQHNTLLGNIMGVYTGYSKNNTIRFKSASGGLLTSTLKYLIQKKLVDKVLVTDFIKDSPFAAHSFFTDNIEKIIKANGSKYQIINVNSALKTVLKEKGTYAFVGLPCHFNALNLFMENNPTIKQRIKYKFGICCSHNMSNEVIEYMTTYLKLNKNNISKFKYRGDGWPKYTKFTLKNNDEIEFPARLWNYLFLSFFYTPKQCFSCNDFCVETSDISFADAWLEKYTSKKNNGYSLIFSHTKNGEELINNMINSKEIITYPHEFKDIVLSQSIGLFYKKHIFTSKRIKNIIYKNILKINSKFSQLKIFKYIPFNLIKYYFYFLDIIFFKEEFKKFKKELLENANFNS